jgi:Na+(H+)/acetate symporter ActP
MGIVVGLVSSVALIAISPAMMSTDALFSLYNPGIVSIPLGFAVTIGVSLLTANRAKAEASEVAAG